jgi:hypothetical protein
MLASLLFPYDDDAREFIGGWLDELVENDFIKLYEADGSTYLEICNWLKHQKIDHPSPSRLPEFREGFAKPRDTLAPDLGPRTRTMDLGSRTIDSGLATLALVNGHADDAPVSSLEKTKVKRQKPDDEGILQEMVGLWQDAANELGLPQISDITLPRQAALRARIKDFRSYEFPDANQGMQSLIAKIRGSPFLTGQTDAAFRASFDWVLKQTNFNKIMDGNYETKPKTYNGNGYPKHDRNN